MIRLWWLTKRKTYEWFRNVSSYFLILVLLFGFVIAGAFVVENITLYPLSLDINWDNNDWKIYITAYASLLATSFAFWRVSIIDKRSKEEIFLKSIELVKDGTSHETRVGAAYSLLNLVKQNPYEYLHSTISVIESAIRNMSEESLYDWVDKLNKIESPVIERRRIPAIKEMCEVLIKILSTFGDRFYLKPFDLGFSDLRGFDNELKMLDMNNAKRQEIIKFFNKSILVRADLRHLPYHIFIKNSAYHNMNLIYNSWISVKNTDIENSLYSIEELKTFIGSSEVRLFLSGDWSVPCKDSNTETVSNSFLNLLRETRVGGGPRVKFDNRNMEGTDFNSAILTGSSFKNSTLKNAKFVSADLRYADFSDSKGLNSAVFEGADLRGAEFGYNEEDLKGEPGLVKRIKEELLNSKRDSKSAS